VVPQDERKSIQTVDDWRTVLLGRLQSDREAVESGVSTIVWDSRLTNSICLVARAAVFEPCISVNPNVVEGVDSSLVASMSSLSRHKGGNERLLICAVDLLNAEGARFESSFSSM